MQAADVKPVSTVIDRTMSPTDDITTIILFSAFVCLVIALVLKRRGSLTKEQRDALIFGIIVSFSIIAVRLLAFLPVGYEGRVLNDLFLAVAAGSFASLGQIYLAHRSLHETEKPETTNYIVTWEFHDGSTFDTLRMIYTVEFDRHNLSDKDVLGLRHGALEPYPWAKDIDYKFDWVRSAPNQQSLQSGAGQPGYSSLPIRQKGSAFDVISSDARSQAAILKPGETKWYSWRGYVEVPTTYWDTTVGRTSFQGIATYNVKDRSSKESVFVLVPHGDENRFTTNLLNKEKDLTVAVSMGKQGIGVRCQIGWCPRSKVGDPNTTMEFLKNTILKDD